MAIKKVTAKKSLVKAQAGKIVKDSTLNKVDNERMKSDLDKMREMDLIPPAYIEEYLKLKNGPKPAKKELEKAKKGGTSKMKKGGSTGDKKWIQKAINPAHKGYCTPMSKPTCTPKRKALAKTLKAMAKKK